ncbi:MAG: aminotransferase class I/II-fold pyridoxal phosphate-dependent enzyme [Gemmatimonadota bacterium]|nr:aminotransferase class I/II-fold pyridoxal phosphate-dependent enzyme [Gemmatimonadota bacterium]
MAVRSGRHARSGPRDEEVGTPHVPAIDLSTTYGFQSSASIAESMDDLLEGAFTAPNPVYARLHNPTVAGFEEALALLEGAEAAVAFSTGMAAISATIMATATPEDGAPRRHVVAVRPLYGGTDHLLSAGVLGSEVSWARPADIGSAIRADSGLVLLETPANPTLTMVDIRSVVRQAREASRSLGHPVAVAVDSTFATPVLQNPLALGADLVLHSATKFLGGHGDAMGGVVACSDGLAKRLRQIRMMTGGILHPLAGYLLHRGLQTLPLRVRAQQESARILAARLSTHPEVRSVHFPGLADDPVERRLLSTQQRGPGSVLSFRVRGGPGQATRVVESLGLITRAVSLGSVDTLVQAPAQLTHRVVEATDRAASGVPDDLLRLSVGLEDVDDLWQDLDQALTGANRSAA